MDETEKILIQGMSQELIRTIGKVNIFIVINDSELHVNFHVVRSKFPIIKHGNPGQTFLCERRAIINVANNILLVMREASSNVIKICYKLIQGRKP